MPTILARFTEQDGTKHMVTSDYGFITCICGDQFETQAEGRQHVQELKETEAWSKLRKKS